MREGPNIARVAGLFGDPARAEVLTALMADRALTATELSSLAGVTKQTMSAHLSKLLAAGLLAVDQQGRHRYYRLAGEYVAELLESMMGVAYRTGSLRLISSPRDPALRKARICYDHLAGERGVMVYDALLRIKAFEPGPEGLVLSEHGVEWFERLGVDTEAAAAKRRAFCRLCLDWSERRQHLAGALGAAFLARICELGWVKRRANSRVILYSAKGERAFLSLVEGAPYRR